MGQNTPLLYKKDDGLTECKPAIGRPFTVLPALNNRPLTVSTAKGYCYILSDFISSYRMLYSFEQTLNVLRPCTNKHDKYRNSPNQALCSQPFTWYNTAMLESKRRTETRQTKSLHQFLYLSCPSASPCSPTWWFGHPPFSFVQRRMRYLRWEKNAKKKSHKKSRNRRPR